MKFVIPPWAETWLGIDWGKVDKAATVMLAADNKRVYGCWDHVRVGKDIVPYCYEIIERVRLCTELPKPRFAVLSHECFNDRGMGNTQADQFNKVFQKEGIMLVKGDRDPQGRLILLREFLRISEIQQAVIGHDPNDMDYWGPRLRQGGQEAGEEYMRVKGMTASREILPKLIFLLPTADGRYGCRDLIKNLPLLSVDIENPMMLADGQDDHSCFVAGTMVSTPNGERPIESIQAGDVVNTHLGPRRVITARMTGKRKVCRIPFSNGRELVGTPNHPIWTESKGYSRLDTLGYGDKIVEWRGMDWQEKQPRQSRLLFLMGSLSSSMGTGAIFALALENECGSCIVMFGKSTTDQYQRSATFITRTATQKTTQSRILNLFTKASTCPYMPRPGRGQALFTRRKKLSAGTDLPQDGSGTLIWLGSFGRKSHKVRLAVSSAGIRLKLHSLPEPSIVQVPATQNTEGKAEPTISQEPVASAGTVSRLTDSIRLAHVQEPARCAFHGRPAPVFNLSVEEAHSYFANGILVSNCDALGHGLKAYVSGPMRPVEEYYQDQIAGQKPDSTIAMDLAMQEAQRKHDEQDEAPSGPIPWPMRKFE